MSTSKKPRRKTAGAGRGPRRRGASASPRHLRIAVCIDTRDGPGRARLLGAYGFALSRGWDLLLVRGDGPEAVRQLAEMRVDGAILFDRPPSFHREVRARGILCVETSARNLEFDDAAVFVDDAAVGRDALRHLASVGFEQFAFCGPSETNAPSARRCTSFCENAKTEGATVHLFDGGWTSAEPLFGPLTEWVRRLPKPCGVLAFDDKVAERIIAACRWARVSVPHDLGVLGIGDDELICELVEPQLSSVQVPLRDIGRIAGELVEALAHGRVVPQHQAVPPSEVVVRASTDRLPRCHSTVLAALEMIRSRAHQPVGTDQIAAAVGVPRRTLERRFVEELGRTIHDVIVDVRLRQAKRLLSRSSDGVGEIARRCGYSAQSAFTRMFERTVGCRPEVYRARVVRV